MVNFKEIYHFSRFQRRSNIFQGGGVQLFPGGGGSNSLFPIETHITCDFPGGGSGPPVPPLDPHLLSQCMNSSTFCEIKYMNVRLWLSIGTYIQFRTVWPCKKTSLYSIMGSRFANEIQCGQMSLHERDSASASQTHTLWLFPSQPNLRQNTLDNMDWGQHISEISSQATLGDTWFPSQELGLCT